MAESLQPLRADGEFILSRDRRNASRKPVLVLTPIAGNPAPSTIRRLEREYDLRADLDSSFAARPLALSRSAGKTVLTLEDPGGELLDHLLHRALGVTQFLRLAIGVAAAVGEVHRRGLIHKDIKPANALVDARTGAVHLTGFGIASPLPRERQPPEAPEVIAGTLAYMAPEQTGRMNRSIDPRSDLYSVGVTFYQMLTGALPFTAVDAMELVHCHIARQPEPPAERVPGLPAVISAIVMKLLAKTAEDRYQTAAGLVADLTRCLDAWEASGSIELFALGAQDVSDVLRIPEKLFGRDREVGALIAAFERIASRGRPELVLVSGYSGIGKSSVVNELHQLLVRKRGLFASGKFDQHKRDIPYATLAQAFRSLVRPLLGKSEAELGGWRDTLSEALGPNGELIVDLVPELTLIIGEQPPVPELPPQDARRRFQLVFRRFIGAFARPEHPLTLFLDDLQWLDAATLDVLEDLLTQPDVHHLMLIGGYRDNEVDSTHPLTRRLDAMRSAGAVVREITLTPLTRDDVGRIIADALRGEPERVSELALLVHDKTGGNPFFAIQFLLALAEEGLLAFDRREARWSWDLGRIRRKGYTDNVVDLMLAKLVRLPEETQEALKRLACLGNVVGLATLSLVHGQSAEAIHASLWEAVRAGFVIRHEDTYAFLHDRVWEAAYSLIPEQLRAEMHLRIGRMLLAGMAADELAEQVFDVVNQFNRGAELLVCQEECERVAELNLIAGKRAKRSTAYVPALKYLAAGAGLLAKDCWERRYDLAFALELLRGECEFLTGELAAAEERLEALSRRAATLPDLTAITCLRVPLYLTLDQSDRAIEVGLECLRRIGIAWSSHPTDEEVQREFEELWRQLGSRPIETLITLPPMSDPTWCRTMDVLAELLPCALFTDRNLHCLAIARMANISLEHGNAGGSCFAYVWLGMLLGPRFGDYQAGFRFAQLSVDLAEKRELLGFKARVYLGFGHIIPWTQHVRSGVAWMRNAFAAAQEAADLSFATFSGGALIMHLLASGDSLGEVQREAETALDFAQKARFGLVADVIRGQLSLIRTLRGLTPQFGCFTDAEFDERRFEEHLVGDPRLGYACWRYWIRKLQARCHAADYVSAIEAAEQAERLLSPSFLAYFEVAEYHFHAALARAGHLDAVPADQRPSQLQALAAHRRQLELWAQNCPENFESRAALVAAEIARIEGRDLDAMHRYEQAVRSARENGFVQNEALANELAARFYASRGFEQIADMYLRTARAGYLRWGADGKVSQLEQLYPRLLTGDGGLPSATAGTSIRHMDVAAVFKALQAVSGEIVLPRLIETIMKIALQSAGADRGLLILPRHGDYCIEAEGRTSGDALEVTMCRAPLSGRDCPEALLRCVIRTQESVIVDDAARPGPFCDEDYARRRHPRSILCLPLLKQRRLAGLLYLENTLTSHAFTPDRVAVLELLAAQAAISLENTLLYADLEEREARIRRLVDSNVIGIVIFELSGRILDANQAFLDLVGYSRQELASGHMSYLDMTPAEWRDATATATVELRAGGTSTPYEKEYIRKDGSRVPVLVGAALFEGSSDSGLAFAIDLTARKQAEEKYRSLMDQAHDAILVLDRAGIVLEANRMTETMLGRRRRDIVGHSLVSVMAPEEPAELDALIRTGSAGLNQLRVAPSDGAALVLEVSAARVAVAGQDAVIFIARDITQRLSLEQQLRQAQKMDAIGQLTGGVAHDFNNILTVITGTIGILVDAVAGDPRLADIGRMIDEAATRGGDLTKQLLAFARRQPLRPCDTDVNTRIIDAARLLRPTLGEQVEIEAMLQEDCSHAMVDPSQLGTALLNLAVNARDAMPKGGKLTFASANVVLGEAYAAANPEVTPGPYVLITVSDTGTGIPSAIRDRVFEPFFTTKGVGKGTGLGLSMVYGFVTQSGGHVKINSEEGRGTTIELYLPLSEREATQPDMTPPPAVRGGNETILVVEDDSLVRNFVVSQLQDLGYSTISAANGPQALALVDQGAAFDLLFTDVIMPDGMNGRELADVISQRRPGASVLYTSGYPEDAIGRHGQLDPGMALLNKPYRKSDLARIIREVLGKREAISPDAGG